MTTPVLTEDGKRLAEALVEAEILWEAPHGFEPFIETIAVSELNAAAASLRLPLEGDASLREAANGYFASLMQTVEWVRAAQSDPKPADAITIDDVDGDELEAAAYFIDRMSAALARPQPEAKGPVAAGEDLRDAMQPVLRERDRWADPRFAYQDSRHVYFTLGELRSLALAYEVASTTPPAEAKTPDAGVGEMRDRAYTKCPECAGSGSWEVFGEERDCDTCSGSGSVEATPTGSAGEDDTGVREALKKVVSGALYKNQFEDDWRELVDPVVDAILPLAPQPPKAETPAGVGEPAYRIDLVHLRNHLQSEGATDDADAITAALNDLAALSTAPAARPGDEVDEGACGLAIRRYREARRDYGGTSAEASVARQNLWDLEELIRALAAAPAADGGRA